MTDETTTNEAETAQATETEEVTEATESKSALVATQEKAFDAVIEQTERTTDFIKKTYNIDEGHPAAAFLDGAKSGIERITNFQKDLVTRTTERIEGAIPAVNKDAESDSKFPVRELTENNLNMTIDGQEELLNLGHQQSRLFVEGVDELSRAKGTDFFKGLAKLSNQAIQNIVDTQERILDMNKDYLRANRELVEENTTSEMAGRVSKFAFDRADAAIDTSKRMVDFAQERTAAAGEKYATTAEADEEREPAKWFEVAMDGVERVASRQQEAVDYSRDVVGKIFSK